MNRRLLIVPVAGALALAGSQLLGGETELPPEPVFPTVVSQTSDGWTDDDWSVNRFVDDPFSPSPAPELEPEPFVDPSLDATTEPVDGADEEAAIAAPVPEPVAAPAPAPAPTPTTTTPPPTTTARDLSQAPPLAEDGSGVDLPEIDDLPDPLGADASDR